MKRRLYATIAVGAVALYTGGVQAADVFTANVLVIDGDETYSLNPYGTSNAEILFEGLDSDALRGIVPTSQSDNFQGDEGIFASINYRGVDMLVAFPDAGAAPLRFEIDSIGFSRTFHEEGNTREENIDLLIDYLKTNEDGTASQLSAELARSSPSDPVAGNPASMQSRAAESDFKQAFTQKVSQVWGCGMSASAQQKLMLAKAGFGCMTDVADLNFRLPAVEVAQLGGPASDAASVGLYDDYFSRINRMRGENKLTLGLDYAQVSATTGGGLEHQSSVISLPLSYSFVFNNDPGKRVIVRMPISLIDTEGASTYQIALGVAYNHPVTNAWSLTPSVGYSAAGSEDLASASALASFSLASSYTINLGGWALNIGNMIGNYSTQKISLGDYESDPGISNTVFTNGILISGPSTLLANDLVMEYFINDTRYTGDDLFTDNSQEVGINFGKLNTTGEVVTSFIKGSVSYTMASGDNDNEADMLRLSLIFKF